MLLYREPASIRMGSASTLQLMSPISAVAMIVLDQTMLALQSRIGRSIGRLVGNMKSSGIGEAVATLTRARGAIVILSLLLVAGCGLSTVPSSHSSEASSGPSPEVSNSAIIACVHQVGAGGSIDSSVVYQMRRSVALSNLLVVEPQGADPVYILWLSGSFPSSTQLKNVTHLWQLLTPSQH